MFHNNTQKLAADMNLNTIALKNANNARSGFVIAIANGYQNTSTSTFAILILAAIQADNSSL